MYQLTRHELELYATQTGFLKNNLEKMFRLLDVLSTLNSNPLTKEAFVLKGGTAINLFVLDFPRISIDVDLDYVRHLSKSEMLDDRMSITSEIIRLFKSEYEIELSKDVYALTQFAFSYKTLSGSSDMLKLEVNYLRRVPVLSTQKRKFKHFNMNIEFSCLNYQEILASKIIALLGRYTPRDLYDVYRFIISPLEVKFNLLHFLILFYGIVTDVKIFDLFNLNFEQITENDIQNKLIPMLRRGEYPIRNELVKKTKEFLDPLLDLSEEETIALDSFYRTGELDIDFLFPQKNLNERIKISPSLEWRIQNIKGTTQ